MPASRFRYSPNARPRPSMLRCVLDACLARAPHIAPPHRRRLHVQAGTGLAPRPPIKCLHYKSETARVLDRGRSRREWSIQQRTAAQETFARTREYWPCTHAPHKLPASRFRYSPNARPQPCRDACLARAPHIAPPHRRRLHVKAGTGLACTGDVCTYRPVLALHPRPPIKCLHHDSDTARMLDRGRSRREWSTPQRTAAQETFARTGQYWPCTHAPHKLPCITIQIQPEC
jgi:hypothetical protein